MKPCWSRLRSGSRHCRPARIHSRRGSSARRRAARQARVVADRAAAAVAAEEVAVVAAVELNHRVGIGWRPELAAGIFAHLDRIDVVEVIADNYFKALAPRARCAARTGRPGARAIAWRGSRPGIRRTPSTPRASTRWRDSSNACVRGLVRTSRVRARGGVEIGHLAMPPRTEQTIEQTVRNVESAAGDDRTDARTREHRDAVRSADEHAQRRPSGPAAS